MPTKVELVQEIESLKVELCNIKTLKDLQSVDYTTHVNEHRVFVEQQQQYIEQLAQQIYSLNLACKFLLSITTMLIGSIIGYIIYTVF